MKVGYFSMEFTHMQSHEFSCLVDVQTLLMSDQ